MRGGSQRRFDMGVLRCGDNHRVDVVTRDQLIGASAQLHAIIGGQAGRARPAGNRDQFGICDMLNRLGMRSPHEAGAENAVA